MFLVMKQIRKNVFKIVFVVKLVLFWFLFVLLEHFGVLFERLGLHAFLHLDVERITVDGAENLIDLTNLLLVLEEDAAVEVRNLRVGALDDEVAFAGVGDETDLFDPVRGREGSERALSLAAYFIDLHLQKFNGNWIWCKFLLIF